jgi:O-antigen/teichoic acid export membrane protein
MSLCGYLGLLDVGVSPAIIRFVAKSSMEQDQEETKRIFVTSALILFFVGMIALAILWFISLDPHHIFGTPPEENPQLKLLSILAGANLFIQFFGTASIAYLMGLQQHYKVNLLRMVLAICSGIATWLALTRFVGNGLIWLSLILLVCNILQYGTSTVWAIRTISSAHLSLRLFSKATAKRLFSFGISSCFLMLVDRIQRRSIPFVISHTLGVASIIFYAIPARLVENGMSLISAMGFPLTAHFSAVEAKDGLAGTQDAWLQAGRFLQIIMMLTALGLGFFGVNFINIWIGSQYGDRSKWIIIYLSFDMLIASLAPNSTQLLVGIGKHGGVARKLLVISLVAVLAAIFAAHLTGLSGIALIIALANIIGFIMCWREACINLRISISHHLRSTLTSLGPAALLFVGISLSLGSFVPPSTYLMLTAQATVASAAYLIVAWRFAVDVSERKAIIAWISRYINKLTLRSA